MNKNNESTAASQSRPPVVVIMGHIDHGKTTILDWYRKTKITESESGGITQHIGAYEVTHQNKRITFIDTPGHEAFSKMRARGTKIADIAILVVAADEGVKPQTREAIDISRRHEVPLIVGINKIDKPEANPERVKQELAKEEIFVESYGGKVPCVEISAKNGTGMDALLELILLVAELEHFEGDASKPAEGAIIESHLDSRRGISATILVQNGTLKKHDTFVIGRTLETARIFENFLGAPISEAGPSAPVRITGLAVMPMVGDTFRAFADKASAEAYQHTLPSADALMSTMQEDAPKDALIFNIILKTDVSGSREALEESLRQIESPAIRIRIIKSEVGDIGESDVKMAIATERVTIVGFKTKIDASAKDLAEKMRVRVVTGEVIYDILNMVKRAMEEMIPPEIIRTILGRCRVLKIFKNKGSRQIIGGRVEEGVAQKDAKMDVLRLGIKSGTAAIVELQRNKIPVESVTKGSEFGMLITSKISIQENDILEAYLEETIKRTL